MSRSLKSTARLFEEDCVRRCLAGDRDAFGPIYRAWWGRTVARAAALVGPADAEDVAQEAMLLAFQYLHKFDPAYRITTFIDLQLRNAAVSHLRFRREVCVRRGMRRVPEWRLKSPDSPSVVAESRVLLERVGEAMRYVPEPYRVALEDYVDGTDQNTQAQREGLTHQAVSFRIASARRIITDRVGWSPE